MSLLHGFPEDTCVPFVWAADDSAVGPRLGGLPPEGIIPPSGEDTRYLLTLALQPGVELSVFAQRSRDIFAPGTYYPRHQYDTIYENHEVLSFLLHGPSRRSTDDRYRSELEPRRLVYQSPRVDTVAVQYAWNETLQGPVYAPRDDFGLMPGEETVLLYRQMADHVDVIRTSLRSANEPASGNKLGGRPCISDELPGSLTCDRRLREQGFRFVLQLDDGYSGGDWPGHWPLYDCGMTMVYARESGGTIEWAYFWLD